MIFAIPYYVIMFQSARISRFMKRKFEVEYGCCNRNISGAVGKDKKSLYILKQYAQKHFENLTDVEKKGKDNAGFKNSTIAVDQISTVMPKPPVEEEKIDEKTLAENKTREVEGGIK